MLIVLYLFNLIRWKPCFGCFILCQVDFITPPHNALIFLKKEKKTTHKKKKNRDFGFQSQSKFPFRGRFSFVRVPVCVWSEFCFVFVSLLVSVVAFFPNSNPSSELHSTLVQRETEAEK